MHELTASLSGPGVLVVLYLYFLIHVMLMKATLHVCGVVKLHFAQWGLIDWVLFCLGLCFKVKIVSILMKGFDMKM